MVLKPLKQSELGWFDAPRREGRETSRQRALNLDAHLIRGIMKPAERTTAIEVLARWHDSKTAFQDIRTIRKQTKNWRLTGPRILGSRYERVAEGDPILLLFEHEDGGWRLTWDVAIDLPELRQVRERCLSILDGQSSRLLAASELGPLLKLAAEALPSFVPAEAMSPTTPTLPQAANAWPGGSEETPIIFATSAAAVGSSRRDTLAPDSLSFILALRSMGYRFEEAVADLIDNSVQAEAKNVVVRLVESEGHLVSVLIADDGVGMTRSRLREALRFGLAAEHGGDSLSKFGLGLKLASISQCRQFTVISAVKNGTPAARRWTIEGMADNWQCEQLADSDAQRLRAVPFTRVASWSAHGTVVVWDHLDRLPRGQDGAIRQVLDLKRSLEFHLGLHFHRFIEGRGLRLVIEVQEADGPETSQFSEVKALNPFGYPRSGSIHFPRSYEVSIEGITPFTIVAHLWPARVELPEYDLDGPSGRQGFYLYRNDRLIVAGGWLGNHQANRGSPVLARVSFDVPSVLDHLFQLDIRKVHFDPPPGFDRAVLEAVDLGMPPARTFRQYLEEARSGSRAVTGGAGAGPGLPFVPGVGFPQTIRKKFIDHDDGAYEVGFEWAELDDNAYFEVDLQNQIVYLNKRWRRASNGNKNAGATDAVLAKSLLFLAMKDVMGRTRMTDRLKQRIDEMNQLLVYAARHASRP